ncbi:MAG: hypothetical protein OXC31_28195 [Spirochaetaceae bacterium]|nr:hypothetical protein [Spirochaetaceae bacterium]
MSERESIAVLRGHLAQAREILNDVDSYYRDFRERELPALGRGRTSAIVIAEVLDDSYTALETLFLRVSQLFENRLLADRWHSDLLEKMTIEVPGIRQPLIARETYGHLAELMRFRHFKRDYVERQYDWDRIESLTRTYEKLQPLITRDLDDFDRFLVRLATDG